MYRRLIEVIGWFFFDLLILGYVEDRDTGLSFRLPGGLDWVIYVEVPSRDLTMTPEEMLEQFCGDIPTLGLLGSARKVLNEIPFIIDEEVQLVCKYLKAYKEKRIDRLYKDGMFNVLAYFGISVTLLVLSNGVPEIRIRQLRLVEVHTTNGTNLW